MSYKRELLRFLILADYVYHRWFEDAPKEKIKPQEVSIPRVDAGCPVPLIYGRCRVRAPILAWTDTPVREDGDVVNGWPSGTVFYRMNMFFVVGIPFQSGTTKLHSMWAGDRIFAPSPWSAAKETPITAEITPSSATDGTTEAGSIGSTLMYYDGNAAQDIGALEAGSLMIASGVDVFQIPSYFDYLTVVLYNDIVQWIIGSSPNVAAYSFEASSYKDSGGYPAVGIYAQIGQESNPINVLYDLLTSDMKLGISASYIDMPSFQAAASKCYTEELGYSRAIENTAPASDHINEILEHIDGALDEDPSTGKLVLTLVRGDYNPADLLHVTRDNCDKLTNFSIGGWTGVPSSVRVTYSNREKDYNDDDETHFNQGNATNQGETEEVAIHMPGVCTQLLAANMARRESAARLRPIIKCSVLVGREFLRVVRGQAIKLTWTNPDIAGLIFRVADVDRGTIEDGKIRLDLISDYFYTFRGAVPQPPQRVLTDADITVTMG